MSCCSLLRQKGQWGFGYVTIPPSHFAHLFIQTSVSKSYYSKQHGWFRGASITASNSSSFHISIHLLLTSCMLEWNGMEWNGIHRTFKWLAGGKRYHRCPIKIYYTDKHPPWSAGCMLESHLQIEAFRHQEILKWQTSACQACKKEEGPPARHEVLYGIPWIDG